MQRLVVIILVLAAVAAVLYATDPMGWFGDVTRDGAGEEGAFTTTPRAPSLEGRPDATALLPDGAYAGDGIGRLDMGLGPATLHGRVTSAGTALPGARVRVVLPPPGDPRGVITTENGGWVLAGLPEGTFDVRATHPEHLGRTVAAPPLVGAAVEEVETLDLSRISPRTDGIHVRVTDAFGKPIEGARVLATTMMWSLHEAIGPERVGQKAVEHRTAETGAGGEVHLLGLPPNRYDVVVSAPTYQTTFQQSVAVAEGRVKHLTFALVPGVSISGVVVDAEGAPAAGVFVTGLHMPTWAGAPAVQTAADGFFVLDGLREGSYMLIAYEDGGGQVTAPAVPSPSRDQRLQLSGTGVVKLQVKDAAGERVTSYAVRPYLEQMFGYTYSTVHRVQHEEGRFETELPPGTWHFAVQSDDGDFTAEAHTVVEVGKTSEVNVALPATGRVFGVVTDAEGNHVSGAEVFLRRGTWPQSPWREQYDRTDADGAFEVKGLALESLNLHVRHPAFAPVAVAVDPKPGDQAQEMTLRLSAGGNVEGHVLRGEEPVTGEQVNIWQGFDFFEGKTTVTDGQGAFRFAGLADGTYSVSNGPFENMARGVTKSGVAVSEGGTTVVDIDLEATSGADGSLRGVVRSGGQAVPDATVMVVDDRGFEHLVQTVTDAQGAFEVVGVVRGAVYVSVNTADGLSTSRRTTVPDEGEGEPLTIEFGSSGIRGRLTQPDGEPVSAAWVQVELAEAAADEETSWERVKASVSSKQDGTFAATGLEPGRYVVRVAGSTHAAWLSPPVTVASGATVDLGTVVLQAGVVLQGRVTDGSGGPLEEVSVSLLDDAGRPLQLFSFVTTGSDGRYQLTGLGAGRYTVRFEAKRFAPASVEVDVDPSGATADAVLMGGGHLEVRVLDVGGQPIEDARIVLTDEEGVAVSRTLSIHNLLDQKARTGAEGTVVIPDLAPGTYRVSAEKADWHPAGEPVSVSIRTGGTTPVVLELQPGS